jgi:hypothetical protein
MEFEDTQVRKETNLYVWNTFLGGFCTILGGLCTILGGLCTILGRLCTIHGGLCTVHTFGNCHAIISRLLVAPCRPTNFGLLALLQKQVPGERLKGEKENGNDRETGEEEGQDWWWELRTRGWSLTKTLHIICALLPHHHHATMPSHASIYIPLHLFYVRRNFSLDCLRLARYEIVTKKP